MISRERALELLHKHLQSQNLQRHSYAVEAVMRALAKYFEEDEDKWGVVGLLHDGDYEETKNNPQRHTLQMVEWLKSIGETEEEIISAILSHNYGHTGQSPPRNKLEWSLYCCDELTGLIVAVALVRPDQRLASVEIDSVLKKWDEKTFARGAKREQIARCDEKLGIPLKEFINISLKAIQGIAQDLGL